MSKKNRNYNDAKNEVVNETTPVEEAVDEVTTEVADEVTPAEEVAPVEEEVDEVPTEVVEEVAPAADEVAPVEESVEEVNAANIVHADLNNSVPAKDIEEKKEAPIPEIKASSATKISGIKRTYGAGQKISLNGARVYASATSDTIKRIARGAYYVFSGTVTNDRLQICIKSSTDPKNIIGWVNVKNIL